MGDFKFRYNLVLTFGFKPKLGLKPKLSGNLKGRQRDGIISIEQRVPDYLRAF